jgi:hypothetical protein
MPNDVTFRKVRSLEELAELDQAEIVEGHLSAERGDPEPGLNRGRAFWHGWRTRMMDLGEIEIDAEHRQLVHQYAVLQRNLRDGK